VPSRRPAFLAIGGTAALVLALVFGLLAFGHGAAPSRRPGSSSSLTTKQERTSPASLPKIRHVFVVNIENKGFRTTWGAHSRAPYLARTLRARGLLLTRYFGTAHHSLGNYLAQISGQGPDSQIQHDCGVYTRFRQTAKVAYPGQVVGNGCVFPPGVATLAQQLDRAHLTWRGYMEDMAQPCQHPRLGAPDRWRSATRQEQYATRHNPFVYFRAITSRPSYCKAHVRPLSNLTHDLRRVSTTRNLSYLTPDLCHDAHDAHCRGNDGTGGLRAANTWFHRWIPRILHSPAFRRDGLLVITADESDGPSADSRACCGEGPGPNASRPGLDGPGGGRIGALLISPYVAAGSSSRRTYNHYSLLGSIEDLFGLGRLGYARTVTHVFGSDVYNRP
jgi:hypothetical protein